MAPTMVDKENAPPVSNCEGQALQNLNTCEAIVQKEDSIQSFQKWWSEGHGDHAAASNCLLRTVDASVLHAVVSAGAGYHNCLGIPELDALLNRLDASEDERLEPLRLAMKTKGGARNQARAVGTLLFSAARAVYEASLPATATTPAERPAQVVEPAQMEQVVDVIVADDVFEPPRRFVCSESFPSEATVAVRLEPNKASSLVTSLPHGAEVMATAARGTYLQFRFECPENGSQLVWVPRVLDGLVLFVEKLDLPKEKEVEAVGGSTEEAIHEQQEQIERCQSWWAWQGAAAAASHPMLSVVDASVLGEVIAAGANYHNCLSADRLDTLQRNVSKSSLPGLEPLKRALQSKGGAKSQARAVGSVIFKEAMEVFKSPPSEANKCTAEAEIEAQAVQPEDKPRAAIVADEVFEPPRRFVCSESFPSDATVAVRAEPSHQSQFLTSLPHGTDVFCSARIGDFLKFWLEDSWAYVPMTFGGLCLFIPAGDRLERLEEKVERQEALIKALQAELSAMRAHMAAVATAFGSLRAS